MNMLKAMIFSTMLIASTATFADSRGNEELCHDVAESDLPIKQSLQKDPSSLKNFLRYIDEVEKNSRMKSGLRDKAYWVFNRKDLPDEIFLRLSVIKCLAMVQ